MADHVRIAIPPKHRVASAIGFLKGNSAIAIARLCGKERNFTGEHFWARGYAVSTVGFELGCVIWVEHAAHYGFSDAKATGKIALGDFLFAHR
jgi:hypothetical protein